MIPVKQEMVELKDCSDTVYEGMLSPLVEIAIQVAFWQKIKIVFLASLIAELTHYCWVGMHVHPQFSIILGY